MALVAVRADLNIEIHRAIPPMINGKGQWPSVVIVGIGMVISCTYILIVYRVFWRFLIRPLEHLYFYIDSATKREKDEMEKHLKALKKNRFKESNIKKNRKSIKIKKPSKEDQKEPRSEISLLIETLVQYFEAEKSTVKQLRNSTSDVSAEWTALFELTVQSTLTRPELDKADNPFDVKFNGGYIAPQTEVENIMDPRSREVTWLAPKIMGGIDTISREQV